METRTFFLLLGSNLGDREKMLRSAVEAIEQQIGEIAMKSALYETAAFDMEDSPDFLNQAIKLNTSLPPKNVLKKFIRLSKNSGGYESLMRKVLTPEPLILIFFILTTWCLTPTL